MIAIVPCTLREARAFVAAHHRHHGAPQGGLFAIGAAADETMVGVAIVGMPVARMLADGWTAEVTRLCTTGERNACSMLYGAAWRAARALGWRRLVTYTLPEEGGGLAPGGRLALPRRGRWRVMVARITAACRHTPDAGQAPVGDVLRR